MSFDPIPEVSSTNADEISESLVAGSMTIVVVDPDPSRRQHVTEMLQSSHGRSVRQMAEYLPSGDNGTWLVEKGFDLMLVALDSEPEAAFAMIETICCQSSATVIAYSEHTDSTYLMRSMRTGAREYLKYPLDLRDLEQAISRTSARMRASSERNKNYGNLFVFFGAKGGVGVTTVACNFAVSLGKDTGKKVLLVDLHLPLGDAALDLGIMPQYSVLDALVNAGRLDSAFLERLLVKHSSGIDVLAAPGIYTTVVPPEQAVQKLMTVTRQDFDYVVVDAGSTTGLVESLLFQVATKVYLVTQVGVPELRNANRLLSGGLSEYASKVEIVLNRFSARSLGVDDATIERALTRPPDWRVPNDYQEVRRMQSGAEPLVLNDTQIARMIRKMAGNASGVSVEPARNKKYRLFG